MDRTRPKDARDPESAIPTEDASGPRPTDPTLPHPALYRDYVVKAEQGKGGLGRVLRAHDRRLDRPVAVKEMLSPHGDATRFLREARLTARLQHPGVVPVHEIGLRADGAPFYAMKLIEGTRFDEAVAGARSLEERVALLPNVLAVAETIAYAHEHRIIHRDLKPSNVLVGAFGETIVIDWGLAKDLDGATEAPDDPSDPRTASRSGSARAGARDVAFDDTLMPLGAIASSGKVTVAGRALGTLGYMPPEQFRGANVDERADVFALGALLYHTVTGAGPYEGIDAGEIASRVERGAPVPIASREPRVPIDLAAIVRKAMAPESSNRYATAKEMAADLKRFQAGLLVSAHRYSGREVLGRWIRRNRRAVTAASLFVGTLALGGTFGVVRIVRERARAEAKAQDLTLVEARLSLDRDPTASLAWLKTAALDRSSSWSDIASIAADARARGVARYVLRAKGGVALDTPIVSGDGKRIYVALDAPGFFAIDMATGWITERYATASELETHDVRRSSDGELITGGTFDGSIVVVDSAGAMRTLAAHHGTSKVAPAPRGHVAASCGEDGDVRLWDLDAGTSRLLGHMETVCDCVTWSPDGASLATCGKTGTWIWDVARGEHRAALVAGEAARSYAWSPSGKYALARLQRSDAVVDVASGTAKALADTGDARYRTFLADDRIATMDNDGIVRLFDPETAAERVLHGHVAAIENFDLARDGRHLVTCSEDGTARVWDTSTLLARVLRGHVGSVFGCAFSPDGRSVLTAGFDGTLRAWDATDDAERAFVGHVDDVYSVAFSPDGSRLATGDAAGMVRLWDLATGGSTVLTAHGSEVARLAFLGGDGAHLVTASWDHTARIWDLATRTSIALPHGGRVQSVAATRDGHTIVTGGGDRILRVWDGASAREIARWTEHEAQIDYVVLSPDETMIASGDEAGGLRVVGLHGGTSRRIAGPAEAVTGLGFALGGSVVVAATGIVVRVSDVRTGELVRVLEGHTENIRTLSVAPDGLRVATAGYDRTVRLWDIATGAALALSGHTDLVGALAFSSDGRYLASAGHDGTTRVWDAHTGRLLTLARSDAPVMRVAFSPDGRLLASVGWDKTVRVISVDPSRFLPDDPQGMRAWLDAETSAVVVAGGSVETQTR